MKKTSFEKFYHLFLRTTTNKLRVTPRGRSATWPVTNVTKGGLVYIHSATGFEAFKYASVREPKVMIDNPGKSVEELAEIINGGVQC